MIRIISDKTQILKYQNAFIKQLEKLVTNKIECWIGYPGGSFKDTVSYSEDLNIWFTCFDDNRKNIRVNLFGVGEPIKGGMNSIIGQINFPFEGINRRIAGALALEEGNKILILHRGRIGGGKPGIGKKYFWDNYRGDYISALDGSTESKFCLVGELGTPKLPLQVSDFIHEIARIKYPDSEEIKDNFPDFSDFTYTDEKSGTVVTEKNEPTVIERTHGIVVNALARELKRRNFKVGNDKNRDLFIHKNDVIETLFEVKTSSSTQCIYSAVGQLLIYSIPILNPVKLVAVLPTKLSKTVEDKFRSLTIVLMYYEWEGDKPVFKNLTKILT